jgi:hypothetical protein
VLPNLALQTAKRSTWELLGCWMVPPAFKPTHVGPSACACFGFRSTSSQLAGVVFAGLLGWAPGGFPVGACGPPPPPWVVGALALGIPPTYPASAPGRTTYHNSPGNRTTRRRVAGAGQGHALCPLRPRAPFIGTQAGALPGWYLAGGPLAPVTAGL